MSETRVRDAAERKPGDRNVRLVQCAECNGSLRPGEGAWYRWASGRWDCTHVAPCGHFAGYF